MRKHTKRDMPKWYTMAGKLGEERVEQKLLRKAEKGESINVPSNSYVRKGRRFCIAGYQTIDIIGTLKMSPMMYQVEEMRPVYRKHDGKKVRVTWERRGLVRCIETEEAAREWIERNA